MNLGKAIAGASGLKGDNWMRHSNPASVFTRFAVLATLVGRPGATVLDITTVW